MSDLGLHFIAGKQLDRNSIPGTISHMSILITPEIEQLVQGIYAGGAYATEADVLECALRRLRQRDELRIKLREGIDELDRGERLASEQVFLELRERAAQLDGPAA